jgi:hypothetical protein
MKGEHKAMSKGIQLVDPEVRKDIAKALEVSHVSDNTARILQLTSKGVAIEEAHKLVTGKDRLPEATKSNIKRKSEKWLLNSPQMQKLAHNAVRDTLKMKPIKTEKGEIYPRVSDRLTAASMVTDRTEPRKQQTGSGPVNLFIDKVQVNQFQAPEPQHMVGSDSEGNDLEGECIEIKGLDRE